MLGSFLQLAAQSSETSVFSDPHWRDPSFGNPSTYVKSNATTAPSTFATMVAASDIQNTVGFTRQNAKASDTMTTVAKSEAMLKRNRRFVRSIAVIDK